MTFCCTRILIMLFCIRGSSKKLCAGNSVFSSYFLQSYVFCNFFFTLTVYTVSIKTRRIVMNILVTLNSNYVPPLTVLLHSLTENNPSTVIDLYVAHSSLTQEDFRRIENSCDMRRTRIHSVSIAPDVLAEAPTLKRLSKETYYRLLAIDFLPPEIDRILYIDPDTVVLRSLDSFYNMDLNGSLMAAAGHTKGWIEALNHRRLKMAEGSRYINAGIILMDIQQFVVIVIILFLILKN